MGIPLVRGRDLAADEADPDVVVVNETLARRIAPDGDAVGRRLVERDSLAHTTKYLEVVGVARDVKYQWPTERPRYFAYRPMGREGLGGPLVV